MTQKCILLAFLKEVIMYRDCKSVDMGGMGAASPPPD